MLLKYTAVLVLLLLTVISANRQCDNTLPDGTVCGPEDYVTQADPESCWQYYECSEGCVTHQTCQDDFKYDDRYNWCTFPYDVDCGSRPCNDPTHCPPPTTAATTTQDCSSTPPIDCEVTGDGYFADEYNCRKYWNCIKGSDPKHIMCPDADDGSGPMMFDLTYMGCNFASQTRCNGRPICDECNNNCQDTPTEPPPCIPDDQIIECENLGAGWHPDTYNCRSYWHCLKPNAEPEHLICDTDENGEFMMWDTTYNGCNYAAYTDCGDRPTCDDCNQGCWTSPPEDIIDCGHDLDCSSKPDGWYADPYSCPKYWNCLAGKSYHHICPEGEMYDPGHNWCDFTERVNCGTRPPCNECLDGCP